MCMGATCPDCSKKSWRGCGKHIPTAMAGVPEDQWCGCEPRVEVDGKAYPHAASASASAAVPGMSWISGMMGGGGGGGGAGQKKKEEE